MIIYPGTDCVKSGHPEITVPKLGMEVAKNQQKTPWIYEVRFSELLCGSTFLRLLLRTSLSSPGLSFERVTSSTCASEH